MCRKIRPEIGRYRALLVPIGTYTSCVSDEVKVPLLCKYNDKKAERNVTGRNKIMYNEKRDSYIMSCVYYLFVYTIYRYPY